MNGQLGRFNRNDPNSSFQPAAGAPGRRRAQPITTEQRSFWGIPDDDKRPYVMDENGKSALIVPNDSKPASEVAP